MKKYIKNAITVIAVVALFFVLCISASAESIATAIDLEHYISGVQPLDDGLGAQIDCTIDRFNSWSVRDATSFNYSFEEDGSKIVFTYQEGSTPMSLEVDCVVGGDFIDVSGVVPGTTFTFDTALEVKCEYSDMPFSSADTLNMNVFCYDANGVQVSYKTLSVSAFDFDGNAARLFVFDGEFTVPENTYFIKVKLYFSFSAQEGMGLFYEPTVFSLHCYPLYLGYIDADYYGSGSGDSGDSGSDSTDDEPSMEEADQVEREAEAAMGKLNAAGDALSSVDRPEVDVQMPDVTDNEGRVNVVKVTNILYTEKVGELLFSQMSFLIAVMTLGYIFFGKKG